MVPTQTLPTLPLASHFAVAGAAAMSAAGTGTISPCVIVMELTGQLSINLPLLITVISAFLASKVHAPMQRAHHSVRCCLCGSNVRRGWLARVGLLPRCDFPSLLTACTLKGQQMCVSFSVAVRKRRPHCALKHRHHVLQAVAGSHAFDGTVCVCNTLEPALRVHFLTVM
eukprot:3265422-Pleurochrysis_carterae.AAC.2